MKLIALLISNLGKIKEMGIIILFLSAILMTHFWPYTVHLSLVRREPMFHFELTI
jgi:hypothetical protein